MPGNLNEQIERRVVPRPTQIPFFDDQTVALAEAARPKDEVAELRLVLHRHLYGGLLRWVGRTQVAELHRRFRSLQQRDAHGAPVVLLARNAF